jgi:hypothetical protein
MENDAGDMVKFLGLAQEDKPSKLCYINVHEHPILLKKSVESRRWYRGDSILRELSLSRLRH